MIVKMKKVTIATLASGVSETLDALADLGVLHVMPTRPPESEEVEELKSRMEIIERAYNVLPAKKTAEKQDADVSAFDVAQNVLSTLELKHQNDVRLQSVTKAIDRLAPLGDFLPSDIDYLRENGLNVKIYQCSQIDLLQTEMTVPYSVFAGDGHARYILAVSDRPFDLPLEKFRIPEKSLIEFEKDAELIREELEELEARLERFSSDRPALKQELSLLSGRVEFSEVAAGMGRQETISYLKGYCPANDIEKLEHSARQMGWGLMTEDPPEESEVPTFIRNPAWIRVIDPVFRFLGTTPGYGEFDVSLWFLVSLSLFFAMLVGDGGYALLFLIGTFIVRLKFKSAEKEPFILLYVFSATTILWGLISGTWFGVERLGNLPVLSRFVLSDLDSFSDNQDFMMQFCFSLGFIHLVIAHMIRVFRLINSIRVFSQIGWIFILSFLYFLTNHLVLGKPLPGFSLYLLLTGFLLSGIFSNPQKNFVKSSILGLVDLPLNIITSFSDMVSYLRLFAVGYATVIVAVSFNDMAASLGAGTFLQTIMAGLLLLLGHTINIALAAMAVLVHGVRLNMLEFSSHLGMTWSGTVYKPFERHMENQPPLQAQSGGVVER